MSKEIAKKGELSFGTEVPEWMDTSSSLGSEEVSSNDITLPRLSIIQDLSPQHKKKNDEYIQGAEVGDFFNTVSNELFKGAIYIIPCYFIVEHVIWKKAEKGGGFFGSYPTAAAAASELPNIVAQDGGRPEDYEIVDTHVHYVVLLKEGSTQANPIMEQAVISMSKSQNKVSRSFNTMIKMAGGDRFSRVYSLSVITDSNKAGQEYMNWKVSPAGFVSEIMYDFAKQTYESIKAGQVKAGHEQEQTSTEKPAAASGEDFDDEFAV